MRQNVKQTAAGSDFRYPETDDLSLAHDLDLVAKKLADVTRRATRDRELDAAFVGTSPDAEWRARETAEKTAAALDSVAEWVERTESRLSDSARLASESQERTAGMLTDALGLMTRRLDEIERKIGESQQPSLEAASRSASPRFRTASRTDCPEAAAAGPTRAAA
jgi:localization factor PodJL